MQKVEIQYLAEKCEGAIYYASSAGRDARFSVHPGLKTYTVEVEDGRGRSVSPNAFDGQDESGFDLVAHSSKVKNFFDEGEVSGPYEKELKDLIKDRTGAWRVEIFDHTVRASDPDIRDARQVREPATLVHNDYTARSGFVCLDENMGDEAAELSKGRFQILNVWRPLVDPVENFPLSICDVRSIDKADLVEAERRAANHIGEISLSVYNPNHRWFYFSEMRPDEALVFKTFDSMQDGKTICSIHTAINLPNAPADARPRESIESRAFVFYR